ncbi:GlcG/HbpS family heme-binding protein [Ramlibacter sp. AN1133]|uniref:GlcG/HbpS family heme-binding protein n=1 Tax=Ramlibacter sp. AN1133 TaxID=3133429 RepID=UPI0030BE36B2
MRSTRPIASFVAGLALAGTAGLALAQAPAPAPAAPSVPQYGNNVTHEQARRAIAGAIAEARRINVPMAVAVVDTAGNLVGFEKMDNTQTASVFVAQDKAVSAAMYRRPTKVFQDGLAAAGAGLRILTLRHASAVEGGIPLTEGGRIIGAIGVSGGSAEQDGVVAAGGVAAIGR